MIYFDNAATTRPNAGAVERALAFTNEHFFNPSARYRGGLKVHGELKTAREFLLKCVADPIQFDLIFTSGGTEGDNHAIFSAAKRGNVVISGGEHAAVFESAKELKNRGLEVRIAPLCADGSVSVEGVLSLVDDKTSFVGVIHVNNETGAVNDIVSIARLVKGKNPRTVFMSDGVQAFGKIPVKLSKDIDLYTVSAHKIGGLKGCGALIKNKNCRGLSPLIFGGGQESGYRSGTENVLGIMAFYYAAEETFRNQKEKAEQVYAVRDRVKSLLDRNLFTVISSENGSPYILSVSARALRGEVLQHMLEEEGLIVGTGSACSSKKPYSRVIEACGREKEELSGVLRLSFSPENTLEEAEKAAHMLNKAASSLARKLLR